MDSQNKQETTKEYIAYLTALTLLFSYAEMILPRIIPFFRLGLSNAVILLSLQINFSSFVLISLLKSVISSLIGGTLLTPFFLISILQSFLSALTMRLIYKVFSKKIISLYGISIAGSSVSAFVQILSAGVYLGQGTYSLLGPMILFNCASGILTAFFALLLKKETQEDNLTQNFVLLDEKDSATKEDITISNRKKRIQIIFAITIIILSVSLFFIKNLYILSFMFIASLICQRLCKRKIYILPHISLWLFIIITSLLTPNGKIIFKIWNISITNGALILAIRKALTLSTISAFSQCATCIKPPKNTIIALSLEYYKHMSNNFRNSKGSIIKRLINSLTLKNL